MTDDRTPVRSGPDDLPGELPDDRPGDLPGGAAELVDRFVEAVAAQHGAAAEARPVALALLTAYGDARRHYHGIGHLRAVLAGAADLLRSDLAEEANRSAWPTVALAAWFHDAVYDPRAADNEERSAAWAAEALAALGVDAAVVDDVVTLVVATTTHDLAAAAAVPGGVAFLDADLSILGAPPAVYDAYATAIRAEYDHVPDEAFRTGRAAVLERFLARDVLFGSASGQRRYEAAARANLARELAALTSSSAGDAGLPGA